MTKQIISCPQRLDDSCASFFESLKLDEGAILDLSLVRVFEFSGAALLLDCIARTASKAETLTLYAPQTKLFALLHFMQFHHLVSFTHTLKQKEAPCP